MDSAIIYVHGFPGRSGGICLSELPNYDTAKCRVRHPLAACPVEPPGMADSVELPRRPRRPDKVLSCSGYGVF